MVQLNFQARNFNPSAAPPVIPTGQYPVVISKIEEKPTNNKKGSYLEFSFKVQGGEFDGKIVKDRLNTTNESEQAVQIAMETLSAICYVTGIMELNDTQQLIGAPLLIGVVKKPREDDASKESNDVRDYMNMQGLTAVDIMNGAGQSSGDFGQQGQGQQQQGGFQQGGQQQQGNFQQQGQQTNNFQQQGNMQQGQGQQQNQMQGQPMQGNMQQGNMQGQQMQQDPNMQQQGQQQGQQQQGQQQGQQGGGAPNWASGNMPTQGGGAPNWAGGQS